jgi:hypothetical protein
MTLEQIKLLEDFANDQISLDHLDALFEEKFNIDLYSDVDFLDAAIDLAILNKDENRINVLVDILWIMKPIKITVNILNKLLLVPFHKHHQAITKQIQEIGDASSVPYIELVLEKGFQGFEYTFSEDAVIAKWFSWALYSIGSEEAIKLLKKHSQSSNSEIASEMTYRLSKLE